jgi:hypothetical protein
MDGAKIEFLLIDNYLLLFSNSLIWNTSVDVTPKASQIDWEFI